MKFRFALMTILMTAAIAGSAYSAQTANLKISGLHCEGCVDPVQAGLKKVPGVSKATLDYNTQVAVVTYDPAKVKVSKIALAVASIPHAMGGNLKYFGALVVNLKAAKPDQLDKAKASVSAIAGVQKVNVKGSSLNIVFAPKAAVTLDQIKSAAEKSGAKVAS